MTYFVNLHGAKIDAVLTKSAWPCCSHLICLEFLNQSPVVYSCSDGGDIRKFSDQTYFHRKIWRGEEVIGEIPQTTCLPQAKVIFLSACLEIFSKDCSVLTYIGYSLSPGLSGIDLISICTSPRCAVSFGILKWRLLCSC